jgi:magnesium-transporting ATPase (P-type)
MIYFIIMWFFIAVAVVSLILAIFNSINYGKLTGSVVRETKGKAMPTGIGSYTDRAADKMEGSNFSMSRNISKTRGKEVGIDFSIKPEDLREGIKNKNPVVIIQFKILIGFFLFVVCTFFAIGLWMFSAALYSGWFVFSLTALFVTVVMTYQLVLGKSQKEQ